MLSSQVRCFVVARAPDAQLTRQQAHSDRVQKGSERSFTRFQFISFFNAACSIARQLEAAELELSDLRAAHETTLAELREHEAKVEGQAIIKLDLTGCTSGIRKG